MTFFEKIPRTFLLSNKSTAYILITNQSYTSKVSCADRTLNLEAAYLRENRRKKADLKSNLFFYAAGQDFSSAPVISTRKK